MRITWIGLCFFMCVANCGAEDPVFPSTAPPFSTWNFCIVTNHQDGEDTFTIQYIRKREYSGTITFKPSNSSEPKIRILQPDDESDRLVTQRAGEATQKVKLGSSEGAVIWNRSGQQLTPLELREKLVKPQRAVMLREKPKDWKNMRDHAFFLDLEVIFIFPGRFFVAIEKAER